MIFRANSLALRICCCCISILLAVNLTAALGDDDPRNLERFQGYLDAAPSGMDVRYAWGLEGGRGENVRIIDIEINWNLTHNDLKSAASNILVHDNGFDPEPLDNINHGTAVLGQLVADDDGIGITGIATRSQIGLINPRAADGSSDIAGAVSRAAALLDPGDIILIEQQMIGPRFDFTTGRGLIPVEFDPEVFEAIKRATSRGIVVVEPAANGHENLDHPAYNAAFDRRVRDSGAIVVGGGLPSQNGTDLVRAEDSNYGSRVDIQGWARSIATCGYGDMRLDHGQNNWYTLTFGGTSGAAAMVAGAAAIIQSILKARARAPLLPAQLRDLLVLTGTPQAGTTAEHIGPRPNLRAAIAALESNQDSPPTVTFVGYNEINGRMTVKGDDFVPGNSVVEINGLAVRKMKYPAGFWLPDGTTTRIVTKGDISSFVPRGATVMITVFTPSSGKRSEPFPFQRE